MRMMPLLVLLLLLLSVLLLSGCVSQREATGQIKVATTIVPLGEFVHVVGGTRVSVTVLVPPGADPHTFEPSPSQIREVADADIYAENGAGLESWMDNILLVNPHMLVVDTSKGVSLVAGTGETADRGRAMDNHIWLSPRNAMIQVRNICDGLTRVDPAGKDYYANNRDNYIIKLKEPGEHLAHFLRVAWRAWLSVCWNNWLPLIEHMSKLDYYSDNQGDLSQVIRDHVHHPSILDGSDKLVPCQDDVGKIK